jgi:hypothetical protein
MRISRQLPPQARSTTGLFDVALVWLILLTLTCLPSTCRGQFQILQDDEGSYAPSDVPSTRPSDRDEPGSLVPTVETTFFPTNIPICPQQWTQYRTCFGTGMPTDQSSACDSCVGSSFPDRDSSCEEYSTYICIALTDTCDCGPCTDDIEAYLQCVYAELGLECPLDCGTITEPSVAPSSLPVMIEKAPDNNSGSSSTSSPSSSPTDAAPTSLPVAPAQSTSDVSRRCIGHPFVPSAIAGGLILIVAAILP